MVDSFIANSTINSKRLFYIHIPRSAGLTLYQIFVQLLGADTIYKLGTSNRGHNTVDEFLKLHRESVPSIPRKKVYLGHFAFGAQNILGEPVFLVTCLRNPVDRVISHLNYLRATGGNPNIDFRSVVASSLECQNGMTRRLRGLDVVDGRLTDLTIMQPVEKPTARPDQDDLHLAIANLKSHFDYVMIYERIPESLTGLRHAISFPPLFNPDTQFWNHSSNESVNKTHSPELIEMIIESNQLDIELYRNALNIFERQTKNQDIPTIEIEAMEVINRTLSVRGISQLPMDLFTQRINETLMTLQAQQRWDLLECVITLLCERFPQSRSFQAIKDRLTTLKPNTIQ